MKRYAELHCLSNFSFLRGASHPEELAIRAAELGYSALAITDECSVAGVVRAHLAAKERGIQLIVGSEFELEDGPRLLILACNRRGYGTLCALITQARRAAPKGEYCLRRSDFDPNVEDCLSVWLPGDQYDVGEAKWLSRLFPGRTWIAVELLATGQDQHRLETLRRLGKRLSLPLVACGDVHMHQRSRRALQDVLTAIRLKTPVESLGLALYANGERHLRSLETLNEIYPPELLEESRDIAERCRFSLDELRYEYPHELVPPGETPTTYLRRLTKKGMASRWPEGASKKVSRMVEHELRLIAELEYEPFFLTVHDIVSFARSQNILCQGRGSAANSAVCYCLGVTAVDPERMEMLVERFISKERKEPPDIDVDFEHERREEVIQYIYEKYGRHRAALAATVITYRPRSAIRDVGKALGLDELQVDRMARSMHWWDGSRVDHERIREAGLDPRSPVVRRLIALVRSLLGFPRHLSQHVGGFVISEGELSRLVPIENAAMESRTVIQWDKDDLEELGLLKVDVLGLGMLTAIRRSFELIKDFTDKEWTLANVPGDDSSVYDMICKADTVGVFQIESRAQMSMLPRLKPRTYYDLVIEVAIVRPGPIQGDMVHPYLRRRNGEEAVTYPSKAVEKVLERTLGVPIFQEQVMQLAIVAAGFSPGDADRLRRAMAAWKRKGGLAPFKDKLVRGMRERGYSEVFAQQIFKQILGFGEYGFPESHSASFALLAYVSAWLKCYEPAAFFCALLNSQPMGFYAPSQLVQTAKRDGVEVRPVDIARSDWDSSLEKGDGGEAVLRLGLGLVKGLSSEGAERAVDARRQRPFVSVQDLAERSSLDQRDLGALASGGALASLTGHRHRARWEVAGVEPSTPLFPRVNIPEGLPMLKRPSEGQSIAADYNSVGLTLGRHPVALLRSRFREEGIHTAEELWTLANDTLVSTAGLVVTRQRPGTATGVVFVTLEDETGSTNLVVWDSIARRERRVLVGSRLMWVSGKIQKEGDVLHVIARRLKDYTPLLGTLLTSSRDFH